MKRKTRLTLSRKRAITGLLFISPWLIGFLSFYVKGLIQTVRMALGDVAQAETGGFDITFAGLKNIKYVFLSDATFNQILVDSVVDIVIDVPLIIFFSLFMAILLNGKYKGRTFFRVVLFLPVIMNAGIIVTALEEAQTAISGGLSSVADGMAVSGNSSMMKVLSAFIEFGVPEKILSYLAQAVERIFTVVRASGVQIIIFIAALQSINPSLYEVAKIEGATSYETFWKVTFPMVSPMILTNVVYTIVDSFATSEIVEKAEDMAFISFQYGYSSAMTLISTIVVCFILLVVGYLISRRVHYHN